MSSRLTASKVCAPLLLAVFFAANVAAADSSLVSLETAITSLVRDVSRSVVTVEASRTVADPGGSITSVQQMVSSGLVVDTGGFVVVAAATISEFDHISVSFESQTYPAHVVGVDYQTGLALLRARQPMGHPVRPTHRHGCAGQMVVALGNSMGLRACPSIGFCAGFRPDGSMQFSTPIGPGSIGGGVFDLSGNLVGVIVDGLGDGRMAEAALAVPAHKLATIIGFLRSRGDRLAGYIGVTTADLEVSGGTQRDLSIQPAAAGGATMDQSFQHAVVVTDVVAGSNAARSGLRAGDLVVSVNGAPIESATDLMHLVKRERPGSIMDFGIYRNGVTYSVAVAIGRRTFSADGLSFRPTSTPDSLLRELESLKATIRELEKAIRR